MRKARLQLFLRRNANKYPEFQRVLDNDKLFETLDDAIVRETSGRPILDFMKWLVDNRAEILDLVKQILLMFK